MRIKFKAPDPRAGSIAQMDSKRGQYFVDSGAAVRLKEDGSEDQVSEESAPRTRASLDGAIAQLPGDHTDADYVVSGMRSYYGQVFTQDDEVRIRDVVKPAVLKASLGLTVDQLKAALHAKGVAIPEGVKLRAELAALLDGSQAA